MIDFLSVFFATTMIMLLAEFGDKTNLVALSLMTESKKPFLVATGSTVGIFLTTIFSVLIGYFIGGALPFRTISIVAGLIFIGMGIHSIIVGEDEEETLDENENSKMQSDNADDEEIDYDDKEQQKFLFFRALSLVALAELGDKSQIFVIGAAASTNPVAILLGAVLGMAIIMFGTAMFGSVIFEKIDEEHLELIASSLFIIAGLWILITALL